MIAAFGTLAFLATMWLIVVLGAAVLEESGAKILAALKGVPTQQPLTAVSVRMRVRRRNPAPMRATANFRAAA